MIERYTLTLGCSGHAVRAETLTAAVDNFVESLRQIGFRIDALQDIDYYVEALSPGSFRIRFTSTYNRANALVRDNLLGIFIFGVIINICSDWIKGDDAPIVIVAEDSVKIINGSETVVVPIGAYEAFKKLKEVDSIRIPIKRTFKAIRSDPDVHYVAIEYSNESGTYGPITLQESAFEMLARDDEIQSRDVTNRVELTITRAILERSKRRWEFYHEGRRISCPILIREFYDKFESHLYQIAPGDKLLVDLKVHQELDREAGVWMDVSYEIVEVIKLIQSPRASAPNQLTLFDKNNGLTSH